jgi:hypothetical protein|nr:MAG TPA: hypothetical protein [Caudoviricetes sp.]
MARINSYPKASSMNNDDVLIIDGATAGTRTVTPLTLVSKVAEPITNDQIDQMFENLKANQ